MQIPRLLAGAHRERDHQRLKGVLMRSSRIIGILAVCLATAFPAGAAQTTAAVDHVQSGGVSFNELVVSGNVLISQRYGNFGITNDIGAVATNGTPAPTATFLAAGNGGTCQFQPFYTCTYWYTPNPQVVSPTALSMDPIGNTATLVATVTDQNNQPHTFNMRLTKPQAMQIARPDLVYNPALNLYVDPATGVMGASAFFSPVVGISRGGYALSGTVDNAVFVPAAPNCTQYCNWSYSNTFQFISGGASVVAP